MNAAFFSEGMIAFERRGPTGRTVTRPHPTAVRPQIQSGRIPRVARLMALAIRLEDLLRSGAVHDYAQLAQLGHVTRARITQIMNLRLLATDIQEALLFLPNVERGRDPIRLEQLQSIALAPDWSEQRKLWADLQPDARA